MKTLLLSLLFAAAAFAQSPHSVTLSWSWSQGSGGVATGFAAYRGTVAGGPYATKVCTVTSTATTTCADTASASNILTEGTKYYYVVRATGPGGESVSSNEASATIPFSLPVAPATLSVTAQ